MKYAMSHNETIPNGERWEHRRWREERPERVAAVDSRRWHFNAEENVGHRNRIWEVTKRNALCTNCPSGVSRQKEILDIAQCADTERVREVTKRNALCTNRLSGRPDKSKNRRLPPAVHA